MNLPQFQSKTMVYLLAKKLMKVILQRHHSVLCKISVCHHGLWKNIYHSDCVIGNTDYLLLYFDGMNQVMLVEQCSGNVILISLTFVGGASLHLLTSTPDKTVLW